MSIYDDLYSEYPKLSACRKDISDAFDLLIDTYKCGGKVLVCGNGGSASDSEHIVGELMKGFNLKRELTDDQKRLFSQYDNCDYLACNLQRALPALSLVSQSALMTAFLNDVAADMLFAQQVFGYAKEGDTLIALSTSGNSVNIINAARTARSLGCKVLSVTGESGGKLNNDSTVCIKLPAIAPYAVQELTLPVYHALCAALEEHFFG